MSLTDIYQFRQLTPDLATAGQPTVAQLDAVARAGYQVVINLAMADSDNAISGEAQRTAALGMDYIHIPVVWEDPRPEQVDRFFQAMQATRGQRRFIHCAANKRVSVFMALYYVVIEGQDRAQALQAVHEVWRPNTRWLNFFTEQCKARRSPP